MNTKRNFLKGALSGLIVAPAVVSAGKPETKVKPYFPNVELLNHRGEKVRFYDDVVRGQGNKVVLFSMIYTACENICPPNTHNLTLVQKELGDHMGRDVFFYSLTLQPEIDRPKDLQAYMKLNSIGPGWTLLTGSRKDMDRVRRKLGFFDRDPQLDANLSQHTGMVRIGNDKLDRWSMMPSLLQPYQLVTSIKSMLK